MTRLSYLACLSVVALTTAAQNTPPAKDLAGPANRGVVTTLAGATGSRFSIDGPGATARFNYPTGVAVDAAGTVYVADQGNNTIRKISPAGEVSTLAELLSTTAAQPQEQGIYTRLHFPMGIAVDNKGIIYVSEPQDGTINKITPTGKQSVFSGQTRGSAIGQAKPKPDAPDFFYPTGVAADAAGMVYVVDGWTVFRIGPDGRITTLAGGPRTIGGTHYIGGSDDGIVAGFDFAVGVGASADGMVYVADTENHLIRKIMPDGTTSTVAGKPGYWASNDGRGPGARFQNPTGVAVDATGTLYVADRDNHTIRKITPDGRVSTLAGRADSPGSADGAGRNARFNKPTGIAVDAAGNVYVADCLNHTIRKITPAGVVSTLAGKAGSNGTETNTRFSSPEGVAVDAAGTLYVVDNYTHTIHTVSASGIIKPLAGLTGSAGRADGIGTAARFNKPTAVAVDATGNAYVTDDENRAIRKITPNGVVTTLAGTAVWSRKSKPDSVFRFYSPAGIAVDASGTVFVADAGLNVIYRVSPTGVAMVLAGTPGTKGSTDGLGSAARFNRPGGVAVDGAGNVYVADSYNRTIRRITPAGLVTTLAGKGGNGDSPHLPYTGSNGDTTGGEEGSADGTGTDARFSWPTGIGLDNSGNLYIADLGNHTIRVLSPAGVVRTLAGLPGSEGKSDGAGKDARFSNPCAIAVDAAGAVYVADRDNQAIRVIR